ncbi:TPA: hypothetical protein ACH3X3_006982 [Trebouxia sp. C0006]
MSRSQQPVAQAASGLPAHQSNKRPLEAVADPEVIRAPYHIIDSGARTATGVVLPEAASKAAKHTASSTPLSMSQPVGQAGAAEQHPSSSHAGAVASQTGVSALQTTAQAISQRPQPHHVDLLWAGYEGYADLSPYVDMLYPSVRDIDSFPLL